MRLETRTLYSLLLAASRARRATGAPAGAERGSRGPASEGEGGPRGRSPRIKSVASELDVGELVADAPHGQQVARVPGIGLDPAPQPLDQRIHAANGHERVPAPDPGEQRFAAEHDARMRRKEV